MSDKSLFRRNLLIIAGFHILLVAGLFFSGFFSKSPPSVTWLDGGGSPASSAPTPPDETAPDTTPDESTPQPSLGKTPAAMATPAAQSEIVLATPTPAQATPIRTPRPEPTPTLTPRPTPTPSATPRHTPKPPTPTPKKKTPAPSPKPSPKKSASASPKPSPKHSASPSASATPKPAKSDEGDTGNEGNPSKSDQTGEGKVAASGTPGAKGKAGKHPGEGGGNTGGKGAENGAQNAAKVDWYNNMIQDRFTSRWMQPALEGSLHTIVKIRIERDGHISDVSLSETSGNPIMDESVMTAAKSVTQIDALPEAIEGSYYDVRIVFKLGAQ